MGRGYSHVYLSVYNFFGDEENNSKIFGIFQDGIVASEMHMKISDFLEPCYLDFLQFHVIRHNRDQNKCSMSSDLSKGKSKGLYPFRNRFYMNHKLFGQTFYVVRNSPEFVNSDWDDEENYIAGIFMEKCCAVKCLRAIIKNEEWLPDYIDSDEKERFKKELQQHSEWLPIIQEFKEGQPDPEFIKEYNAYQDLCYYIADMEKDLNHPGRKWIEEKMEKKWENGEFDEMYSLKESYDDKWSEALQGYFDWMHQNMNMVVNIGIGANKLKTNGAQLYWAYNEIWKLREKLGKYDIITEKIYELTKQ